MIPCVDCTTQPPSAATHGLKFDGSSASWVIRRVPNIGAARILYCHWHATVRTTQRNAALRRRQATTKEHA
jgi:hypothetical protein